MTSAYLHNRITKLFCNYTYDTLNTAIAYLYRLERYAERQGMVDVADHAQIARINLSRKIVED